MSLKNTFTHHVLFWLKNRADRELLIDGLRTLEPIETIRGFHIGVPADTFRDVVDRTYDVGLLVLFDDLEGHDVYEVHPIHEEFIKKCGHLWEKVSVHDTIDA